MAKFIVKHEFRDIHTKEIYSAGQEIEMTVKRAKEAEKNLAEEIKKYADNEKLSSDKISKYEGGFLERVE